MPPRVDRLLASERCCAHLVERGTAAVTVAELAAAAGVPERTFYRWFPTKAACIAPVLDAGSERLAEYLETAPAGTVGELLAGGYEVVLGGPHTARTARLFPVLHQREDLWAEVSRAVGWGERLYRAPLAARLGVAAEAPLALVVAAAVSSGFRLSVEALARRGCDPRETHRALLDASPISALAVGPPSR